MHQKMICIIIFVIFAPKNYLFMAARLKKQDKSIIENLPVKSIQWIQQPHNLTFVKGEMTKPQLRIFVSLVEQLQTRIHNVINANQRGGQLSLFDEYEYDEYKRVSISIPLKEIATYTSKYKDVAEAAEKLFSLVDRRVFTDEEGIEQVEYAHVIDKVVIPKDSTGKRKGNVVFKINKSMIESVFSLDRYVRYIKDVATDFQNPYAGRLYMFIEAYKAYGKWKIKYNDLREVLGCREWDKEKKEWVEKKHAEWRAFKNKILEASKKELYALAEKNVIDCFFDYKIEKKAGSKLADAGPDSIIFIIKTTDFGKLQETRAAENKFLYQIEGVLRNDLELKTSAVVYIMKLVKSDNAEFIFRKLEDIKYYVVTNKTEIKKVRDYVYTSLKNALTEREESYVEFEEVDASIPPLTSPIQPETEVEPEKSTPQVIENRCTKAVEKFWNRHWHRNKKIKDDLVEMNNLISDLDLGLQEEIPSYDICKLESHLEIYHATVVGYPTSATIIDLIKKKEGILNIQQTTHGQYSATHASSAIDRRRSAPCPVDTKPEDYE